MRLAVYTTTSVALATGVVLNALHQRSNFYSACVYLAQSNACLMILTNVALLAVSTIMLALQKLLYGPLRPIEVEQLYEKAWFAVTETCLAMTIFREEVGGWFLVMFVSLLIGKVWGWIGEGRVEVLEQQPPSNPRLFHVRLSTSLVVSTIFDVLMLSFSVRTVLQHARPNMMVMFAFEFAVLCVTASSTCGRYLISLREAFIIRYQTNERRAQMRREREHNAEANAAIDATHLSSQEAANRPSEPDVDIDSVDIDVPGWEEKGRWIFYLELTTDFLKLILYLTFFCVLCMFYGMPIHIIRDVALTIRSFHKRILDFIRYRQATRDMNTRYPDATPEEVSREDCCIICREDMRPWPQHTPEVAQSTTDHVPPANDERFRPKKLPCGHVLHFACLRSWLERQQNCPTCRAPVLVTPNAAQQPRILPNQEVRGPLQPNVQQQAPPNRRDGQPEVPLQNVFQLGPLRIIFGGRNITPNDNRRAVGTGMATAGDTAEVNRGPLISNQMNTQSSARLSVMTAVQLQQIEQQLSRELRNLQLQADQLHIVRALQQEYNRLRNLYAPQNSAVPAHIVHEGQRATSPAPSFRPNMPNIPILASNHRSPSIGSGHEHLPSGMTLPDGWTVLPLHPVVSSPIPLGVHASTLNRHTSTHLPSNHTATPSSEPGAVEGTSSASGRTNMDQAPNHSAGVNVDGAKGQADEPAPSRWDSSASATAPSHENGYIGQDTVPARMNSTVTSKNNLAEDGAGSMTEKGKGRAVMLEDADDDA